MAEPDDQGPLRAPIGTHDVLAPESARWLALLRTFETCATTAGFSMVHTPIFEDVRLFRRGIGDATEVVGKEMYEFTDRGGRQLALRPEGTASVVRAFLQHRPPVPYKAWYATPAFRYERPQAGRFRQHHQVGIEVLGIADADVDVEVLTLASTYLDQLGLTGYTLRLNTLGDPQCRPAYLEDLRRYLTAHRDQLCEEHGPRFERNPLRVLDCKTEACRAVSEDAPKLAEHLCEACAAHFARVREGLDLAGITYQLDAALVRGLDYYTRTTFEYTLELPDAGELTILGGGRYDGLVAALGGPETPGIGFGSGIERVLLACDGLGVFEVAPPAVEVFCVDTTDGRVARDLVAMPRRRGVRAERAYEGRSMKSQLKAADRSGATLALLVGPTELEGGSVTIRNLRDGMQWSVASEVVVDEVTTALQRSGGAQ